MLSRNYLFLVRVRVHVASPTLESPPWLQVSDSNSERQCAAAFDHLTSLKPRSTIAYHIMWHVREMNESI